ncbi:hypothetical protein SELMODRAFT_425363 [Selaginella moellendorffii]|uniref:Uncharacterized protein n=1 Tax=Selaginella moellendorffii TaxID=88036 RepID=D8SSV4_SELML|nr:hypothetical protein SELMODRAFT_425363 [Selaginella moellendorffii]
MLEHEVSITFLVKVSGKMEVVTYPISCSEPPMFIRADNTSDTTSKQSREVAGTVERVQKFKAVSRCFSYDIRKTPGDAGEDPILAMKFFFSLAVYHQPLGLILTQADGKAVGDGIWCEIEAAAETRISHQLPWYPPLLAVMPEHNRLNTEHQTVPLTLSSCLF